MKEILNNYVEHSFGELKQAEFKFKQFEYNYKKYFPEDKNAFVLDVGIGSGEMLSCMKKWGYVNYLGIDVSSSTVNFCKSQDLNCLLVQNATEWLNNHKEKFSLITVIDVLEHIPKQETILFLKAIKERMKKRGILLLQVPNLQAPDGQLHRYNDFTHEIGYVEHSLQQVIMAAGFDNVKFYGFETFEYPRWKRIIKIFRWVFWKCITFARLINGNLHPKILHPVFFVVAMKD